MELNHFFICVEKGAPEAEVLRQFGLAEGSVNRHPGQGTANRRFFFHNAYIELLWLENTSEARSPLTSPTMLYERLSREHKATSPFGVCFRPETFRQVRAPFASWSYRPHYLPAGLNILDVGEGVPLSEPMWLFTPFGIRPDRIPKERRQPLMHRAGFLEITALRISSPKVESQSSVAECAVKFSKIELADSEDYLVEVGFDNEKQGRSYDFRPALPMIFSW